MKFLPFLLSVSIPVFADLSSAMGIWDCSGNTERLYPSPLGYVYHLASNEGDGLSHIGHPIHSETCSCSNCHKAKTQIKSALEVIFPKRFKITKKIRYLVFDFYIRLFPALEKGDNSLIYFSFIDSGSCLAGSTYSMLHGNMFFNPDSAIYNGYFKKNWNSGNIRFIPQTGNPAFHPQSVRIIYDLKEKKVQYSLDGKEGNSWQPTANGKSKITQNISHYGIAAFHDHPEKGVRRNYIELSDPYIHTCDNIKELPPPLPFHPYDYSKYRMQDLSKKKQYNENDLGDTSFFQKLMKHKNPDLQYAYASYYLLGKDTDFNSDNGIRLLKKAADRDHVLALYQLGVCYWRGYGVRKNLTTAKKYLKKSNESGYPEAGALLCQIEMEQRGYPWFTRKSYQKLCSQTAKGDGHDIRLSKFIRSPKFLSPKMLSRMALYPQASDRMGDYLAEMVRKNESLSYLPAAIQLWKFGQDAKLEKADRLITLALQSGQRSAFSWWLLRQIYKKNYPEANMLTPEIIVYHSDDLLFNFLYILITQKNDKERIEKLQNISEKTILVFRPTSSKNAESEFLSAIWEMWGLDCAQLPIRRLFFDAKMIVKINSAFDRILHSADSGYAPAQYFIGKFYFYNDLPEKYQFRAQNELLRKTEAERYLRSAAEQGHICAALLYCKLKMTEDLPNYRNLLPVLQKLCKMNIPEAFYLYAIALGHLERKAEALQAAENAARLGDHRGYYFSALYSGQNSGKGFWRKFIQKDLSHRLRDSNDVYWIFPYAEYAKSVDLNKMQKLLNPKTQTVVPSRQSLSTERTSDHIFSKKEKNKQKRSKRKTRIKFREPDE